MFINNPNFPPLANYGKSGHGKSRATPASSPAFSRRGFIGASGSLVIGVSLLAGCSPQEAVVAVPTVDSPLKDIKGGDASPALFIEISADNQISITCHRSEMGQQTWTAMSQIICDELEADWDKITLVQAEGHPRYGDQNTDGSRSVRNHFHRLRLAGGAMRHLLKRAAADHWNVTSEDVYCEQGFVIKRVDQARLSYGELAQSASTFPIPAEADITLKEREDWRYIGQSQPSMTTPKIVKGEGIFGIDVQLPDMVHAVVARPPTVLGTLTSYDDTQTLKVPGVIKTVQLPAPKAPVGFQPLGGIAVVATDTWAAIQGREALELVWDAGPNGSYTSETYDAELMETVRQSGDVRRERGNVSEALAGADTTISAEYFAPHLSQSPMEPPCATARWEGDTVECWACVQAPQGARATVAGVCGIAPENVTMHVTLLGGGFGRKSKPDFAAEAALIARDIGQPVKLTWTREDDIQHGYYHSVSAQRLEGALDSTGRCTGWLHRTSFPPIGSTFTDGDDNPGDFELELGASDNAFDIPNIRLESGRAKAHIRIGWLRSVANVYHAFAVQSFANELAHAAGADPKDYLINLYGNARTFDPNTEGAKYSNYGASLEEYPIETARLVGVTDVAADMAEWGRTLPQGHGLGIATHRSFLTYVSTVVEVHVSDSGVITLVGVWSAADAGTVVNPDHTKAQLEGGTLYGLSNALYGQITTENGAVVQSNFPDWRVMRISEAPHIFETQIIASNAPPGGVGEPGTPPAAPALTNAIFAATGQRIRRLPILGDNNVLAI